MNVGVNDVNDCSHENHRPTELSWQYMILNQLKAYQTIVGFAARVTSIYIYKIAQSVFVCYLSPRNRLDMQRPKLACRRVPTLGRTFVVFYVDRGHRLEEN